MKSTSFKTNINCSSCVAKVTKVLDEVVGENNWKVDTQNPQKILSVTSDHVSGEEVIKAVAAAGYKAQLA
ncbi:MAG TPA: heavy-metal-associated domain-containing protein [Chitinophagaceae bacterium]|nr:heavy-metal-associated domain-containing protein [Chitinophagaceae bacterium]